MTGTSASQRDDLVLGRMYCSISAFVIPRAASSRPSATMSLSMWRSGIVVLRVAGEGLVFGRPRRFFLHSIVVVVKNDGPRVITTINNGR
jgi:hypothetical protein